MSNTTETSKKKLLVVEDDLLLTRLYERMFQHEGIEVITAHDGEEALQHIRDDSPDLVLLDIKLPKIDGVEVLKLVRDDPATANMPVLVLSNYGLDEYVRECQRLGIVGYFLKATADPNTLVKQVKELLGVEDDK